MSKTRYLHRYKCTTCHEACYLSFPFFCDSHPFEIEECPIEGKANWVWQSVTEIEESDE